MYRVIITRGSRGTISYPAADIDSAQAQVKREILSMKAQDNTTEHKRIVEDQPTAWRIVAGKFRGDTLQIVRTADSAKPANYNVTSITIRETIKANKARRERFLREREWRNISRKLDRNELLKSAHIEVSLCRDCKGTGVAARLEAERGFILLPTAERRGRALEYRPVAVPVAVPCKACNGKGRV